MSISILQALDDPNIFGTHFKNRQSWANWRTFIAALFGLALNPTQRKLYRQCTGKSASLKGICQEAWMIVGRRGGKSFVLAILAVFLACFRDYKPFLAAGEVATIVVIAADRKQARTILKYCLGIMKAVPLLRETIIASGQEHIELASNVRIEVKTASFRTVRGYTIVAALLDEIAFWRGDDSANPDSEILAALRPAMATVPGAMLFGASSPYARRGVLYDAYREHYGKDGDPVLVWQAPTRVMNPSIPQAFLDAEYAKDPSSAAAEYGAAFRSDIEAFLSREAIEACIIPNCRELPYAGGTRYAAFVDPSGGSSDSMTLAVAHKSGDNRIVLDLVREVSPPFSPSSVIHEFCATLKAYNVHKVSGDRYGGEFPRELFRKQGIVYEPAELPKSDLYRELLPLINSGRVELLDQQCLANQLNLLERRTARSGKDSIDHAPGAHDDVANACAGAIWCANTKANGMPKASPEFISWASRRYNSSTAKFSKPRAFPW